MDIPEFASIDTLRKLWWLHDSFWHAALVKELGFEQANRINLEAAERLFRMMTNQLLRPPTIRIFLLMGCRSRSSIEIRMAAEGGPLARSAALRHPIHKNIKVGGGRSGKSDRAGDRAAALDPGFDVHLPGRVEERLFRRPLYRRAGFLRGQHRCLDREPLSCL